MRSTIFSALVALLIATAVPLMAQPAASCEAACAKYRECAVEIWQKNKKTPTDEQKKTLYLGCMKTCGKNKPQTLACYKQAVAAKADACMTYWGCVQSAYNSTKK